MEKYTVLLTILCMLTILPIPACPHEFSSEDKRPFFEQYE